MRWFSSFVRPVPVSVDRLRGRRRRRRAFWSQPYHAVIVAVGTLLGVATAHATSVVPPSFPELVAESEVIARGSVTSVESRWVTGPEGRVIKTFVTFAVEKALKGTPGATIPLEFLGGTVGADSLQVSGMPEFKIGESELLFVRGNGVQFCPLTRFTHGRYHLRRDAATGRKLVTRDDDSPLTSPADVQLPEGGAAEAKAAHAGAPALTSDQFEADVAAEVIRQGR